MSTIWRSQPQNGASPRELPHAVEHAQHRVVDDVARLLGVGGQPQRQRVGRALERAIDLLERGDLAAAGAGDDGVGDVDLERMRAHVDPGCAGVPNGRSGCRRTASGRRSAPAGRLSACPRGRAGHAVSMPGMAEKYI
ncbi:MAG: hypothetical protein NVV68_12940 [Dokdonella sp.]|nr:hypothetical protein [Dokdonella sp.]